MKRFLLIFATLLLLCCKKDNDLAPIKNLDKNKQDSLLQSNEDANNTFKEGKNELLSFKNRAEELIYIREYLKENLPKVILKNNPKLVEKAQQELIILGYNPTMEEAAKKTIAFSNYYEGYMELIVSTKMPFNEVKKQLESTGKITFEEYINKKNEDLIYIDENVETINTSQEESKKETVKAENTALQNILAGRNIKTEKETEQENTIRKLLNQPTRLNHDCDANGTLIMKLTINSNGDVINVVKISGVNDSCLINFAKQKCYELKYTTSKMKENTTAFYTLNFN